jgi:alpha-tubulin suppressor-like RCC1 family protein
VLAAAVAGTVLAATAASAAPVPVPAPGGQAVAGWGQNDRGQLGSGTSGGIALAPVAASLPAGTRIRQVAPGCNHALALTSTGTMLAWGDNAVGELGNGTTGGFTATPVKVKLPAGVTVRAIAAGCGFSLAIATDGTLYSWGSNDTGQLGSTRTGGHRARPARVQLPPGVSVRAVSGGEDHALAVTTAGQVYAWGANSTGQLGNGSTGHGSGTPARVTLPHGARAATVAAGEGDSLAVTTAGQVLGWGDGALGSLGNGHTGISPVPGPALLPPGLRVRSVFAGCLHTLAVTVGGSVLAWGDNSSGQLGTGIRLDHSTVPRHVRLRHFGRAVAVGGGCVHSVAVSAGGKVLAWGMGALLGNGSQAPSRVPVPVRLPAGQAAVSTGGNSDAEFSLVVLKKAA